MRVYVLLCSLYKEEAILHPLCESEAVTVLSVLE